jgi:hypothetical protein
MEEIMGFLSRMFVGHPHKKASRLIWQIIEDEAYQNNMLPAEMSDPIKRGLAVDKLPTAVGPFGQVETNPIPVNGAIGELAYLSRLESLNKSHLLFHRLGSVNFIDVYETVSINGRHWDLLFLDPYHLTKSKLAPEGFRLGEARQFSGFHVYCAKFPYDFDDCKTSTPDMLRLAYVPGDNYLDTHRRTHR